MAMILFFSGTPPDKFGLQYSIGAGFAFHFFKRFGLFVEYNYGKCTPVLFPVKSEWRYGLRFQF